MARKKPVTTRNDPVTTPTSDVRRLIRFTGDVSSESAQSLVKSRVSAVDVVCLADRRDAVGNKTGDDQGSPGPDVTGLDGGAGEPPNAVQHDVMAVHPGVSTQTCELLDGTESRLEEILGDHRAALCHRVVRQGERLQIGGEPRIGQRGHVERRAATGPRHPKPALRQNDVRSGLGQQIQGGAHVPGDSADHFDVAFGRGRRKGPRAGCNTVRDHLVGHRRQRTDTLDLDHRRAGTLDRGSHLGEKLRDVYDLWLARSVRHPGHTLGQHGCHQDVLGGADAGEVQPDLATVQPVRSRGDEIAVGDMDRGAQRLQTRDVQIQTSGPDRVTARYGHMCLTTSGHQGAKNADRGSQCPNQLIVGAVPDAVGDIDLDHPRGGVIVDDAPESAEQLGHDGHIKDGRHVRQASPAHSQQGPRHQLEGAVLGTNDRHLAAQAGATDDTETLHHGVSLSVLHPSASAASESIVSMVNLTRIYTRTGDDGSTALGDFSRTTKTDPQLVAYADTDEANSSLGVAVTCGVLREDVRGVLVRIQNDLFDVGADLCTPLAASYDYPPLRVQDIWVDELEADCDRFNDELEKLGSFILPGGTPGRRAG